MFNCYTDNPTSFLLAFSNWSCIRDVYEFEGTYDPSYLNLDKNDPDAWRIYAEKVRTIMAKALNIPKVEMSYRNGVVEFDKVWIKFGGKEWKPKKGKKNKKKDN